MDSINMITKSNLGSVTESHAKLQIDSDSKPEKTFKIESLKPNSHQFIYSEVQSQNED